LSASPAKASLTGQKKAAKTGRTLRHIKIVLRHGSSSGSRIPALAFIYREISLSFRQTRLVIVVQAFAVIVLDYAPSMRENPFEIAVWRWVAATDEPATQSYGNPKQ
jgi:hypothetical protein